MTQAEKAKQFKSLHIPGSPLALYNIWDAGSAKAIEKKGAKAVATGSWSVAAAQGYKDGEAIPLEFVLQIARRISDTVEVPLTLDFEGGYAADPATLTKNVRQVIQAGAIGINFEDQIVGGSGLYDIADQVNRIKAIREAAEQENVPLFINARTDVFLKAGPDANHADLMEEALNRGTAYAEAGGDGFFVPGLTDSSLIKQVCSENSLPVNVMMRGELNSVRKVAELGVGRASFGPGPYVTAMSDLANRFEEALG
ncbi:MAG: isocitrate lyase/phosphoenolpyruvate mutase family protein [Proteobacteria bacterium]|nr:isocitrate lyase/phosphoenolpyruvate mutase family protein [Pseudomonadota bacterium]